MRKYCFVLLDSLNRAPYIQKYIKANDYSFDIILWDRGHNSELPEANRIFYFYSTGKIGTGKIGRLQKIIPYIKFARFANKVLQENDYDGVFVFAVNTACLCYRVLTTKYKKRFILDIRDYWKGDNSLLYKMEEQLLSKCFSAVISSKAYERFLPRFNYVLSHNSQLLDGDIVKRFRSKAKKTDKIVIACIGGVKRIEYDKQVIDYFGNDDRFEVRYIGRGYEALSSFCSEREYSNIIIEGEFTIDETISKYEDVNIVLNMYGNHTPYLDYALSNKLYFSAQLGMPILVCPDTYMAEIVEKNNTGFAIDLNKPTDKDKMLKWYSELKWDEFYHNCDVFLEETRLDEQNFRNLVTDFTSEQR